MILPGKVRDCSQIKCADRSLEQLWLSDYNTAAKGLGRRSKRKAYAVVGEFLQEFKEQYGSVACTDLLGFNLSDPKQFADAKTHEVAKERCPTFIRGAVELVETLI